MPKKYPWPTEGLQKYSERLKRFIHERCTCYPEMEDDMFEVPEFMVIDPLKRRPSKFRLSFADDFPYTRFKDNDFENERTPCTCNTCPLCHCDVNLKPFPHFVLRREKLPHWIQKEKVHFRKSTTEEIPTIWQEKGALPCSARQHQKKRKKSKTKEREKKRNEESEEIGEITEKTNPPEIRKKISAFSFDDYPSVFPYL